MLKGKNFSIENTIVLDNNKKTLLISGKKVHSAATNVFLANLLSMSGAQTNSLCAL